MRMLAAPLCLLALQQPARSQEGAPAAELVVIDLRPKEEKDGFGLTPLDGKCNEEVYRIADVASDPGKVQVLRSDLAPLLGMEGKTLTVLNWSIYYNRQVRKKGSMLEGVGIQGYSVPAQKKQKLPGSICSREQSAGGWYEGRELTSVYFPLISEFEGTFAGRPVTVRVVHSPTRKLTGKFEGETGDREALLETVHKTAEAVATAVIR